MNKIDTGLIAFELPFDRGTEIIYFNPNDIEFYIRITEMINKISELYDDMSEKYETVENNMEKLKVVHELNEQVKAAFDEAFGNKVSDTIFKYVSPHGIIKNKNQYFAFYILEYLLPLIAEKTGEATKEANKALLKAVKKHTSKYQHKLIK